MVGRPSRVPQIARARRAPFMPALGLLNVRHDGAAVELVGDVAGRHPESGAALHDNRFAILPGPHLVLAALGPADLMRTALVASQPITARGFGVDRLARALPNILAAAWRSIDPLDALPDLPAAIILAGWSSERDGPAVYSLARGALPPAWGGGFAATPLAAGAVLAWPALPDGEDAAHGVRRALAQRAAAPAGNVIGARLVAVRLDQDSVTMGLVALP